MFDGIHQYERTTAACYFVLAWLTGQLGDSAAWIRLPSLLLGPRRSPHLPARRAHGGAPPAGLVTAAITALSPFAIFYSDEARAYATLIFLVTLSTLLLIRALDAHRARAWVPFVLATPARPSTPTTRPSSPSPVRPSGRPGSTATGPASCS